MSRKQVLGFFLFLLVVLSGYYFYRDLHLHLTTKIEKLPDMVVHDIKVDKMINGRRWRLVSPRMETKNNILYGDKLDVTITEKDGTESHILAKKGIFVRENSNLQLTDAHGTMISGNKSYGMETEHADYNAQSEIWTFTGNLMLTDHETVVTGQTGVFNSKTGDCNIKSGGKISWDEE